MFQEEEIYKHIFLSMRLAIILIMSLSMYLY